MNNELYHHGIMGMKWGHRRWQNEDGSYKPGGEEHYYTPVSKKQQKKNYKQLKKYGKNPYGEKFEEAVKSQAERTLTKERADKINQLRDKWYEAEGKAEDFERSDFIDQMYEEAEKKLDKKLKALPETDRFSYARLKKDADEGGFDVKEHRDYNKLLEYEADELWDKYEAKFDKTEQGKAKKEAEKYWDEYNKEVQSLISDMLGKNGKKKVKQYKVPNQMTYADYAEMAIPNYLQVIGTQKV